MFGKILLLIILPLLSLASTSPSNDQPLDINVGQALRSRYYQRRAPTDNGQAAATMTKTASQTAGGMGLSLSNRNHISLGHLTKKESLAAQTKQDPASQPYAPPSNPQQTPHRPMRVMGQPINPNIVSHLHPDVSPRKIHRLWRLLGGKDDKYWTSEEPPRVLRQRGVSGMMSDASMPPGTNTIDRVSSARLMPST